MKAIKRFRVVALAYGVFVGVRYLYRSWTKPPKKDTVDQASQDSFPASDAPAWNSR